MEFPHQIHIDPVEGPPGTIEIDPPYAGGGSDTVRASVYMDTAFCHGYVRMSSEEIYALIEALMVVKVKIDEKTAIRKMRGSDE